MRALILVATVTFVTAAWDNDVLGQDVLGDSSGLPMVLLAVGLLGVAIALMIPPERGQGGTNPRPKR